MTLQIDIGEYRVTSDPNNYIINKKRVVKEGRNAGDVDYDAVAFFPTLGHLVAGLVEIRVRGAEVKTLEELAEAILQLKRDLWKALPAERRMTDREEGVK